MRNILCPEDWIVNSCRLNEWLVRFSPEDCQLELRHDGGGGDPGCGLRGRRVAQTLLRLRRGEHLDDDLHRTLLWVQSQDQHVLLQVSHNLRANYFISNLRCKVSNKRCQTYRASLHCRGTSGLDIDLRVVDINQCHANTSSFNIFGGTDKCKKETTTVTFWQLFWNIFLLVFNVNLWCNIY